VSAIQPDKTQNTTLNNPEALPPTQSAIPPGEAASLANFLAPGRVRHALHTGRNHRLRIQVAEGPHTSLPHRAPMSRNPPRLPPGKIRASARARSGNATAVLQPSVVPEARGPCRASGVHRRGAAVGAWRLSTSAHHQAAAREIPVTRVRLCCPTEAPEMRRSLGATPRFARWRRPGAQACYPAVIRALCSPAAHRDKRTRPPYPLRSAGGRAPRQAPCR
jgi:hypothetical protein